MALAEDDHMVETFAADRSDQSLDAKGFCQGERGALKTSFPVAPHARAPTVRP